MLQKNKKTNCETRQRSPPAHLNVRPPTVAAHPPTWSHYPESIIVQLFSRAWGCRGGENCPSSKRTVPWAFLDLHQPPRGAESDRTNPSWQHPDFLGNIEAFLGKIQASWARSRRFGQHPDFVGKGQGAYWEWGHLPAVGGFVELPNSHLGPLCELNHNIRLR